MGYGPGHSPKRSQVAKASNNLLYLRGKTLRPSDLQAALKQLEPPPPPPSGSSRSRPLSSSGGRRLCLASHFREQLHDVARQANVRLLQHARDLLALLGELFGSLLKTTGAQSKPGAGDERDEAVGSSPDLAIRAHADAQTRMRRTSAEDVATKQTAD